MHDLSKYTVPTSFVEIAVPTKVCGNAGGVVVSVLPSKVVGMQAVYESSQIQELKGVQHKVEYLRETLKPDFHQIYKLRQNFW